MEEVIVVVVVVIVVIARTDIDLYQNRLAIWREIDEPPVCGRILQAVSGCFVLFSYMPINTRQITNRCKLQLIRSFLGDVTVRAQLTDFEYNTDPVSYLSGYNLE